jgi:D-alanyl-D-alanine carboxypeptidase
MAGVVNLFWAALLALVAQFSAALDEPLPEVQDEQERITLPGVAANRPTVTIHVVREGDTLDRVATLYATTVETLFALNPDLGMPAVGSALRVPEPGPAPAVLPCGDLLAPLDKDHEIPPDCVPPELSAVPARVAYGADERLIPPALAAFTAMADAAAAEGHEVLVRSSYRSWEEQRLTFESHVERMGLERASMVSARPGHSEHQLGTTVDVTNAAVRYRLTGAFGATEAGRWLAGNAWRYGFVLSYPAGSEAITGYSYEPWHFRWVGSEAAAAVQESGLTLHTWLLEEWKPGRHLLPNP